MTKGQGKRDEVFYDICTKRKKKPDCELENVTGSYIYLHM